MRIRIRIPIRMLNIFLSEKDEIYVTISLYLFFFFFFWKREFWIRDFTFYYVKKKGIENNAKIPCKVEKLAAAWKKVK